MSLGGEQLTTSRAARAPRSVHVILDKTNTALAGAEDARERVPGAGQVNEQILTSHGVAITSGNGRLVSGLLHSPLSLSVVFSLCLFVCPVSLASLLRCL